MSSLGGLFGGFLDLFGNVLTTDMNNTARWDLANYNFELNKKMWQMNNDYNKPVNQMLRLQEAGLNPNLMYGSGSASTGNSSSYPTHQMPNIERYQLPSFSNILYQAESLASQKNVNSATAEKLRSEAVLNSLRKTYQTIKNNEADFDYNFKKEMRDVTEQTLRNEMYLSKYNSDIAYQHSLQEVNNTTFSDATLDTRIKNELLKTRVTYQEVENIKSKTGLNLQQIKESVSRVALNEVRSTSESWDYGEKQGTLELRVKKLYYDTINALNKIPESLLHQNKLAIENWLKKNGYDTNASQLLQVVFMTLDRMTNKRSFDK